MSLRQGEAGKSSESNLFPRLATRERSQIPNSSLVVSGSEISSGDGLSGVDKLGSCPTRPNSNLYNGGRSVSSMVGSSSSDGLYLPSFLSYQGFSGEGNSFLHPRLANERLCGGAPQPYSIPLPFLADVFGPEGNVRETPHYRSFSFEFMNDSGIVKHSILSFNATTTLKASCYKTYWGRN